MKQYKRILRLVATALMVGTVQAELVLVKNGKSLAPIILPNDATPDTHRAADALANYFKKISGAKPEIVTGWPDPVPEPAIWVGVQAGLAALLPETALTFQHPEEILLVANAKHLIIAGRDRVVANEQVEFGTANAVYTFLQDKLDVRWLWPGTLGEDCIEREEIVFAPFEYRYHPQFRMRTFRGITEQVRRRPIPREVADWSRFQRLGFGSLRVYPRTSFSRWSTRFFDTHPEYLALQPDGTRNPPIAKRGKVCMSNPRVREQWIDDVTAAMEENPADHVFGGSPADSHSSGICVCDRCRAWDVQEGAVLSRYRWRGLSQEYVAMSDRYATFVNLLADKLKERYPNRDLYVYDMAYGPNTPAPLRTKMADNTIIAYVGHFPFRSEAVRQAQKAEFKGWSEKAPHLMFRPNYWYYGGGVWGLPEVALTKTIEDYRFLAEHHCIGLDIDTVLGHWATQGPQYYLLAQLAWNPMQDGQALLADYYHRGFGPAASAMAQYWNLMDKAQAAAGRSTRNRSVMVNMLRGVFNDERLSQATEILDRATAAASGGSKTHQQRVAFVRTGFDFVRKMFTAASSMDRVHETQGSDTEAIAATIRLWEDIQALSERFPYAINYIELRAFMENDRVGGNMESVFGPPSKAWLEKATNVSTSGITRPTPQKQSE